MPAPRGSTSIYKNLFDYDQPAVADDQPTHREKKIECLIDFYYYTGRKPVIINNTPAKISYNSLLEVVGNTFFLSSFTVHNIIKANGVCVAITKQQWKDQPLETMQKHFKEKWPQLVW
jgi:hypothetical protein